MPIAVQIAALAALMTYAIRRYVAGHALQITSPPLRSFFRTGNMAGLANASTGVGTVLSPICIGGKAWSDNEKNRQDRVGRGCNSPDSKCARPRGTPLGRHRRLHHDNHVVAANRARSLAERGDAQAQALLGFMYEHGRAVAQSYDAAVYWYSCAAEQGHRPRNICSASCTVKVTAWCATTAWPTSGLIWRRRHFARSA